MPANENEKLEMPELTARSESGVAAHKIVYTGVFTAIYFVVLFAIGMLGFFGPQFMLISFPLVWLINGTVIILMLNKIRSFGALTFLGIIIGSLMVLTGHAWTTLASTILTSLIADLLSRSGNYTNSVKNIFSYGILQLWYIGPLLPIFMLQIPTTLISPGKWGKHMLIRCAHFTRRKFLAYSQLQLLLSLYWADGLE
ncbi:MptD family putative ECF transporter S component [Arcanobacterium hippocoleae]